MMAVSLYNKAYKFRLLPNKEQHVLFLKTFGCVRFIYNKILDYTHAFYKEHGKYGSLTPAKFKEEFHWLKEVDSLALANAQLNLEKAYRGFFSKKSGFPRYKSKKDTRHTYTTNNQKSNCLRIEGNSIKLPKIGLVRFIEHRQIRAEEEIKNCTVTRSPSGKYYISVIVEGVSQIKPIKLSPERVIGLDFSMSQLYVASDGKIANYPRYYRHDEKKLYFLQRAVSRKKKGSNNRYKARLKLARWHEHITNKRQDFLHKLSCTLANKSDAVVVEDLNMKGMSQALNFGKSVSDNGWGMFLAFLGYKLVDRGKQLIKIDKWFASSKICSACGNTKKILPLSQRVYDCEKCGHMQDRDRNASLNIRTAGMAEIAW